MWVWRCWRPASRQKRWVASINSLPCCVYGAVTTFHHPIISNTFLFFGPALTPALCGSDGNCCTTLTQRCHGLRALQMRKAREKADKKERAGAKGSSAAGAAGAARGAGRAGGSAEASQQVAAPAPRAKKAPGENRAPDENSLHAPCAVLACRLASIHWKHVCSVFGDMVQRSLLDAPQLGCHCTKPALDLQQTQLGACLLVRADHAICACFVQALAL